MEESNANSNENWVYMGLRCMGQKNLKKASRMAYYRHREAIMEPPWKKYASLSKLQV